MPNVEEINFINRLKEIERMFDNIMKLLDPPITLYGESRQKAQALLKDLKNRLKEDVHFYTSDKNKDKITTIDINFYLPAILGAKSNLRIKVNSVPDIRWFDDLYNAKIDIIYWLHNLVHKDLKKT